MNHIQLYVACAVMLLVSVRVLLVGLWRRSLAVFRITLPSSLTLDQVAGWLTTVQTALPTPRLLRVSPIVWEVWASARGIEHLLIVPSRARSLVLSSLFASLPGARAEELSDAFHHDRPRFTVAAEARLVDRRWPLAADRAEITGRAILTGLQPLLPGETTCVQLVLSGAGVPAPVVPPVRPSMAGRNAWQRATALRRYQHAVALAHAVEVKQRQPLFHVSLRVGVATQHGRRRAYGVLGRVWAGVTTMNTPGACVIRRWWLPGAWVSVQIRRFGVPLRRWPLFLNTAELAGLLAVPYGALFLPGLARGGARQLPPPQSLPVRGALVGVSNHPSAQDRPLALGTVDRTRHTYVVGPAGSGKSVLLARFILGDIAAGYGVVAIDPKGDLIPDVLNRLTPEDAERVLIVDAAARDLPIGFNPLAHARSEADRELVVDGVLTVFREIWSGFWGPRTDSVLRSCLTTLVNAQARDGSAFTLCEIFPLLIDDGFRRSVVTQPTIPAVVRAWWQRYDAMPEGERAQTIGPVLNKVEAFTSRTAIRLMLGQSTGGLDFRDVFTKRRVVLVSLAQGAIGSETSRLLGALLVFSLWRATLERVTVPAERRRPVFAYVDEAQDLVKLPVPVADMLAQARGFGLGLTLANQYLAQLPSEVRAAVLGTVRTQISFAPQPDDARLLERHFTPLTAEELGSLAPFEFAMRPCVGGGTGPTVTGRSLPLPDVTADGAAIAAASRQAYGVERAAVEAGLIERVTVPRPVTAAQRRETVIDTNSASAGQDADSGSGSAVGGAV